MAADDSFTLFGDRAIFALEVKLLGDPEDGIVPLDSAGSWGAWRLWVADQNLSQVRFESPEGFTDIAETRWFLAPLFRWIAAQWVPLLHETRLPPGALRGDSRLRWARLAYLAMLESAGDDLVRFGPWQDWASRHALRSAAEGGIIPDVFFQRIGDDIELTWGDRLQPGAESAIFSTEEGVARAPVDAVAKTLQASTRWFLAQAPIRQSAWAQSLTDLWAQTQDQPIGTSALTWYLDASPTEGPLTQVLTRALARFGRSIPCPDGAWMGRLAPEVAMFGDLSPKISDQAASALLAAYFAAQTSMAEPPALSALVAEAPAWATLSPWDNGYALARDVLEATDPDEASPATPIEAILASLGVSLQDVDLGEDGPRGVALAGEELRPTILVNRQSPFNRKRGRRFTLAHEFCHILFDRDKARPLTHSSTPWASPSIEQRANAFAAMLLMPYDRIGRPSAPDRAGLKRVVDDLADRLEVSRVTLKYHLANLGEITPDERDELLGDG